MQTSILCSACKDGRSVTDPESGELICSECGIVFLDKTQEIGAEWRTFDSEANERIRVGSPTSLAYHDMGLATLIGKSDNDSSGRKLGPSMHSAMQRLRTWDFRTRAHTSTDRNLIQAFSELGRLKDKIGLSDAMIEKTAYIYRKAQEKRLIRGRSTSSILAAAIYIACREGGASRTLADIAAITNIKRKTISRGYRLLINELGIVMPLIDPAKCIAKIANKANLTEKTKRMAIGTMNKLVEKGISAGKAPMGLAATVLYLSALTNQDVVTQTDIARAAGVTEVTIRNRVREVNASLAT